MKLTVNPALVQFFEKTEEGQLKAKVIQANSKSLTLQLLEEITAVLGHDAGRKHGTGVGTVLTIDPETFEVVGIQDSPAPKTQPKQTTHGCMPEVRKVVHATLSPNDPAPVDTVRSLQGMFADIHSK